LPQVGGLHHRYQRSRALPDAHVLDDIDTLARIIREYAASGGWRREVAVKMLVAL
jgi:hypothetical protein